MSNEDLVINEQEMGYDSVVQRRSISNSSGGERKFSNDESIHEVESNTVAPQPPKKLKYPKSIFFIFSNEFCERYSYYGMRTILSLYLVSNSGLRYDETTATIIYHTFVMLCYFTPLIGGIVADSLIGKYKTILYVSIVYAIGNVSLATGALPQSGIPHRFIFTSCIGVNNLVYRFIWVLALLGLFLIGAGTGGIKPCVSSFGGDQFVIPEQQKQLDRYFAVFYFSINAGSVLSCFFTPMMREIKCLGQDTCYSLAFGIPAVLMVLSIIFFVLGKRMYKMKEPEGTNTAVEVTKCIGHAISQRIRSKRKREHWLDYADDKYSPKLIQETKILLSICLLFSPTIVFWSLYEQQGSKWTFQANRMDGRFGSWVLLPDQMQTMNAVLCLLFIPIFEYVIYPVCAKIRLIRTSLQKICWGGFVAAISFVLSGILQFYINASNPVFPVAGQAQLRVFNGLDCVVTLEGQHQAAVALAPRLDYTDMDLPVNGTAHYSVRLGSNCTAFKNASGLIELNEQKASSYYINANASGFLELYPLTTRGYSELDKTVNGNPKLKLLYDVVQATDVVFSGSSGSQKYRLQPMVNGSASHQTTWNGNFTTDTYKITVDGRQIEQKIELEPGAVYVCTLFNRSNVWSYELFTLTPPNNISILWQTPQYVVITAAEILLSITGMEFSYNQSPDSMKSFISSLWLVTDSFGNIIVLIIEGVSIFSNEAYTYFLFAGLMVVVMIIFVFLAVRYKPPDFELDENNRVVIKGTSGVKQS